MQAQAVLSSPPVILQPWPSWNTLTEGLRNAVGAVVSQGEQHVGHAGAGEVTDLDPYVLVRAQRGDHGAFREIVDHYEARLRLLAFQILADADLMNDALQDTFVKAYRALRDFRADAALGTWLYRICYRVCLDYLRKGKTMPSFEPIGDDLIDPVDATDRFDLREQVIHAVAALPLEQRVVLLLVDHDGYDYTSVAEALDVPLGTVASRLSIARAAIRAAMRPQQAGNPR